MTGSGQRVYSYFPGCSLEATNRAYDVSTRNVARVLGLEMVELEDWNCCGATAYMAISEQRAFVLAARNLALAQRHGRDLVAVCSGCYLVLHKADRYLAENDKLRAEVAGALAAGGMEWQGGVRVRHFLDVIVRDLGEEAVRRHVVRPLKGLKVAPYYGCQITRPFADIDDPELPTAMDRLLSWLGADPVPFPLKSRCCGGMAMTTAPPVGRRLSGQLLRAARRAGADCLATACPLCQINLEAYQKAIGAELGEEVQLPVLYFTQLAGAALGLAAADLALADSLTPIPAAISGAEVAP